jgi:hypothetical protein
MMVNVLEAGEGDPNREDDCCWPANRGSIPVEVDKPQTLASEKN